MTLGGATVKHLTVRNIPQDLAVALDAEKQRRNSSLNQIVIDLLKQSLGVDSHQRRSNGLGRLAGQWTAEEHEAFERAIAPMANQIDAEIWD